MHDYTTILGVIDLRQRKFGYNTVRQRYRIGNSGITLIMNRFKESELSLDDLKTMEPQKVIDIFYPPDNMRHKDIPMPDFDAIHSRMMAMGKRADLGFLWLEYKEEYPDGYQQTQFYKLIMTSLH